MLPSAEQAAELVRVLDLHRLAGEFLRGNTITKGTRLA